MSATTNRDLASEAIWQRSLARSQQRRELAESARKEISRRKSCSLAVTAAMAASPVWPSVAGSADLSTSDATELANKNKKDGQHRVLLSYGDEGSAVAALQRILKIQDDGVYGPQTERAVKEFQKRKDLRPTGEVNIRTWLKLFPNDAVVYAPGAAAKQLGFGDGKGPQWAAVSSGGDQTGGDGDLAASVAEGTKGAKQSKPRSSGKRGIAASIATVDEDDVSSPPEDTSGAPPVDTPGDTPGDTPADPVPDLPDLPDVPDTGPDGNTEPPKDPEPDTDDGPDTPAPKGTVGEVIQTMMAAADRIDKKRYPYLWGGGHNPGITPPYDCSGAVSAVLKAGGFLKSPMVSGQLANWGAPGKGAVTIYANSGHVYMSIMGKFFGTTRQNPGGGAGWFNGAPRAGFAVRHVPFGKIRAREERIKRKKAMKKRLRKVRRQRHLEHQRRLQQQRQGYVTPAPGSGKQQYTPPPSSSPTGPEYTPPPQSAPAPAPAPAPGPAPAPVNPAPVNPAPVTPPADPVQQGTGTGTTGTQTGAQATPQAPAPTPAPAPAEQPAPAAPVDTGAGTPAPGAGSVDTGQQQVPATPDVPTQAPATGAGEGVGTPATEGTGAPTSTPQGGSGSGEGSGQGAGSGQGG